MDKVNRIKELVEVLNRASYAYYNTDSPIMDDAEFDMLLDELKLLEYETNIILTNSPTHHVGAEVMNKLKKSTHDKPMLSLYKCHAVQELVDFAGNDDCYLSIKCDGLSTRLIYNKNGDLISAATRGDGKVGQDVLFHIKMYDNVPLTIPYKGGLVIDGESVIFSKDFEDINSKLSEDEKFKNCRNLASGTLANLDTKITKERHMKFVAWRVIEGLDGDSNFYKLKEAEKLGFVISPMWTYNNNSLDKENISRMLDNLKEYAKTICLPMDGAVMAKDSISLSESMGRTDKFFRHSIAYKYEDETYITTLKYIDWTVGRTGSICPTAVFEPVEIDGSTVERASVHNVSILTKLDLHDGDTIEIFKANQIIPQVRRNISSEKRSVEYIKIPGICPVCGGGTKIIRENASNVLICTNPNCLAKKIAKFTHFVSRKCMNIDGLSEKTLELLINNGYLNNFHDIYELKLHKDKLIHLPGLGLKSVEKLLESIENSRNVTLDKFITALGIDNIGSAAAKTIAEHFKYHVPKWFGDSVAKTYKYTELKDFGEVMENSINNYYYNNYDEVEKLIGYMLFVLPEEYSNRDTLLDGKIFVITGSTEIFKNRAELSTEIEKHGGKVSGSISKGTSFLINNDINSNSSKNRKAKELSVPIITEKDFMAMING